MSTKNELEDVDLIGNWWRMIIDTMSCPVMYAYMYYIDMFLVMEGII